MGPNPNSRYGRMPDDPKGEGLKAINNALARIDNGNEYERDLINSLWVLYDKDSIPDSQARDYAYPGHCAGVKTRSTPKIRTSAPCLPPPICPLGAGITGTSKAGQTLEPRGSSLRWNEYCGQNRDIRARTTCTSIFWKHL